MANLIDAQAKICLTSAGCLVHDGKVLLIKHKKLGLWLCPGGHMEANELPHQAAEREFWEETGIKVRAKDYNKLPNEESTQYLPCPFASNLHWVSQEMYEHRLNGTPLSEATKKKWAARGCEQHVSF